jgi:beta-mannosidase
VRADVRATVEAGDTGTVAVALTLRAPRGGVVTAARLVVTAVAGGDVAPPVAPSSVAASTSLEVATAADGAGELRVAGERRMGPVARWWPHTHGAQPLYEVRVVVTDGEGRETTVALGRVGFRTVELSTEDGGFALAVNGVPIFCRGACWTPLDAATLTGSPEEYRRSLAAVRDAGMNMLRVGGPMVYETDLFHDLCDELGLLLWQDFMFANMDYPEDAAFVSGVRAEARQALGRWQGRPSLAVLCGDSEGEQQAAMWGAPPASWHRPLFRETLPALCAELRPDVPYWPSSASGGAFPHQPSVGSTSYYGVGAYLRPLEDARRSEVRFATECLAFANVPQASALASLAGGGSERVHTPAWKAGVPRDLGAGWDFDDVRDHYLERLFGLDPVPLRSTDPERYLALGRITTGEVMEAAFSEWRRGRSACRGALVWFWRDLVAGAGWGLLDVAGRPKAAYHYLRRALRPLAVFFTDEGLNGAFVHVVNERARPWAGQLQLRLFQQGETRVGLGERAIQLDARGSLELPAASLLGGFSDTTYAYHFGPPAHDLAVASLVSAAGVLESEAFFFPVGRPATREAELGLVATAQSLSGDEVALTVATRRFAQAVAIDVPGFAPEDDYFHVQPGGTRTVRLTRVSGTDPPRGTVQACNARSVTRIVPAP